MDTSVHGSLGGGDPVVWVEPGDSEDEEEVAPTTKGLSHAASIGGASKAAFDDALLGKINRTTAEGKRISTLARHNDPVFDIRNDKFDPCKYLAAVHKETPRSRMEYGVERLQKMAGQGGKVSRDSKMLIRNNFGRFVAAHDKMQALRGAIVEIDGKSLDELEATLDAVAGESDSVYKPMLELQQRTAAIRSALAVLDRHQALFLLAAQIKEDGAAGEYDKVVVAALRAREQLGGVRGGMMLHLMDEVEAQVDIVRRALRRKLADAETPVQELSKAIHYLGKLDPEGVRVGGAMRGMRRRGRDGALQPTTIAGECMRLQQEAVLQMMQRSIANFQDQVSKLERSAEDAVQHGDFSLNSGDEAVSQHLARMVNVFEGLASALVSMLSSIVVRHAQRLIALEDAADKHPHHLQRQTPSHLPDASAARSSSSRLFLDKILGELVDTLGEALYPIFVKGCTVQQTQLKMSHTATLNALDTVCQSRAELDRVWDCPPELLERFDEVIIALCTATLEEDFQQMHRQLELRFQQHKRLDRETWRRDIETGTTELPGEFRTLLLEGIHRVHGLVAPSAELRGVSLTLCIRSMEGFLDLLHDLALGPDLDPDAFLRYWAVRHPGISGDQAVKDPGITPVPNAVSALPLGLLHYPLSGAGPVGAGRALTGEEGVQMLLMVLADVAYLRANIEGLLEECAEALQPHTTTQSISASSALLKGQEDTQVVAEAGVEVLMHLCSTLENLLEDKYIRGCSLAIAAAVESGVKSLPPKGRAGTRDAAALSASSASEPGHAFLPAADDTRPFVEEVVQILVRAAGSFRSLGTDVQDALVSRLVEALWRAFTVAARETRAAMELDPKAFPTLVQVAAALQIHADLHFLSSGLHRFEKREDGSSRVAAVMELLTDWLELLGVSHDDAEVAGKAAVRDSTYRCKLYLECFR